MNNLVGNIDIIIVISFLVINLIVGLYSGRSIKTIKEYAIGNRNFSTATIAATIVATWLSGASFTVTTTETYNNGLYFIIPGLGDAMSFFIISYLS
jgi:Na+/proline symporter